MRWLILLATVAFASGVSAQTAPQAPVTEQITVSAYGPWTHGFESTDKAEAHIHEHPTLYIRAAATEIGNTLDGRPVKWSLVSVEFKTKTGYTNFPARARAKVEVTLAPWSMNNPKDAAKAEAEASGAKPIEDELDQRMAELEALDEEMSDAVVDKLTSDLLNKINDIDVMGDTLVSVIARMTSKGPAMGLWSGGKTAHRYVSQLEEMMARVQHVKDSVTGLQDHAWGKTSALIDGLLDEFDALETDVGLSMYRAPDGRYADDPDRIAFWDARDALKQSILDARSQTTDYDFGMSGERFARSRRAFEREEKRKKMSKEAIQEAEAQKTERALKSRLTETEGKDALKAKLDLAEEESAEAAPGQSVMRRQKVNAKSSPLSTAARTEAGSPIRREAGADQPGPRTMDADGGDASGGAARETAPRVETPKVTSPFALAREENERAALKAQEKTAKLRFNERTWLNIEQQIYSEQANTEERYAVFGGYKNGIEVQEWEICRTNARIDYDRRKSQFTASCPAYDKDIFSFPYNIKYQKLQAICPGNYYTDNGYGKIYPHDARGSGAREYGKWHQNQLAQFYKQSLAEAGCEGPRPEATYVRYGNAIHIVVSSHDISSLDEKLESWARQALAEHAGVRVFSNLEDIPDAVPDEILPAADFSNAPFQLYETSALKELRDMQQEYHY